MTIEPTSEQRQLLAGQTKGEITLAQFYVVADKSAFIQFCTVSEMAVANHNGRRTHYCHVDQILAGGDMPETIASFRNDSQTTPFYMMNLNKYYAKAQYQNGDDISGEKAYSRYGNRIVPYLVSVGDYPDYIGHVRGTFAGDETGQLHDRWSEFDIVYYPSRQVFLRMMTNAPVKGIHHRDAGLERAVLVPSSDWSPSS